MPEDTITFFGADAGDHAGALATGDFNGDSAVDVAIGAAAADGPDNQRADAGEVYLFLGPFAPGGSLDAADGDHDAIFFGAAAGDNLGRALTSGDFNGDGLDDIAIAAPSAAASAGMIYVMFGGDLPRETDFASSSPDVQLTGASPDDYAGIALAAGNLESDDRSSLIIGALLADGPDGTRTDAGAVYAIQGQDLAAGESIQLGDVTSVLYGAGEGDHLGESLGTGDINADGTDDLVVVATFSERLDGLRSGAGQTYVFISPVTLPLDLAGSAPGFRVIGVDEGDQLGHSLAIADVNGDGADDLWLGAVSADGPDNGENLMGEAELVLSQPGLGGNGGEGIALDPEATVFGPEPEARLGRSTAAGDIDGDGRAELLISAPNVRSRAGQVYLFRGGEPLPEQASDATTVIEGIDAGDILGHESLGIPPMLVSDIGEGTAILIAAPAGDGPENDRIDCGEVYLIPGASLLP